MPIHYRVSKRKNNMSPNGETQYIMQAIHNGEVDLEYLAKEISKECTLSRTDVKAVLYALSDKVQYYLEDGKIVNLNDLGRFKIGFQGKAQAQPEQLKVKDIKKFYINFQPATPLKHWLKNGLKVIKAQ